MDIKGNGIDYIEEKSNTPEEFKDIVYTQSKITNDILTSKDVIRIVGPCSEWVEGEGWVTEIPQKVLIEKIEEIVIKNKPSSEGFNNDFWSLFILACIFSGGNKE